MWVVLDGPEKAGKSTIAGALMRLAEAEGRHSVYRHFSGVAPVTAESLSQLMIDLDEFGLVLWDRSWASEAVYRDMGVPRLVPGAIAEDGEEMFTVFQPIKIMIVGPSSRRLAELRGDDDLAIVPLLERNAFLKYAQEHHWARMENHHEDGDGHIAAQTIIGAAAMTEQLGIGPPTGAI